MQQIGPACHMLWNYYHSTGGNVKLEYFQGAGTPQTMEAEIKKLELPVTFLNPELGKVPTFSK